MKINTTKRLLCALVAVLIAMTVLPGISVFAEEKASITLKAPSGVDITGMKVTAYQVLTASESSGKLVNFREHAAFSAFFDGVRTGFMDKKDADGYFYIKLSSNVLAFVEPNAVTGTENVDYIKVKASAVEADVPNAGENYLTFGASLLSVILSGNKNSSAGMAGTQIPATNASAAKLIAEWLEAYAKTNPAGIEKVGPVTAGQSSVTIPNVDEGYWLVVTNKAPQNVANVRTVLRTTKGTDTTIDMKLEKQSVDKEVRRHDPKDEADYGKNASGGAKELFDYKITAAIQDMTDYGADKDYIYRITDTMENQQLVSGTNYVKGGAPLEKGVFKVEFVGKKKGATTTNTVTYVDAAYGEEGSNNKNLNEILKGISVSDNKYVANGAMSTYGEYGEITITADDGTTSKITGQQFILDFNVKALHDLWEAQEWEDGVQIIITYTAELTSDAEHKNGNDVEKKYHNNPNIDNPSESNTEKDKEHTDVWSFGFDMTKEFTGTDGRFENVKFELYGPYTTAPSSIGATDEAIEFVEGTSKGALPADPEEEEEEDQDGPSAVAADKVLTGGKYDKADSADLPDDIGTTLTVGTEGALKGHLQVTGLAPGYYILKEVGTDSDNGYTLAGEVLLWIGEDGNHALLYKNHNGSGVDEAKKGSKGHFTTGDDATSFANLMKKYGEADTCLDTGAIEGNDNNDWLLTLKLLNYKENEYPETGGMGVLLLGIGGVLMIAAAAYILLSQKKRSEA